MEILKTKGRCPLDLEPIEVEYEIEHHPGGFCTFKLLGQYGERTPHEACVKKAIEIRRAGQ